MQLSSYLRRVWSARSAVIRLALTAVIASSVLAMAGVAQASGPPTVTTVAKVGAALSGPVEGMEGQQSFFTLEAFLVEGTVVGLAADAEFADIACQGESFDATMTVADDLSTATLVGTVVGSCENRATGQMSLYTASFDVTWIATAPIKTKGFATVTEEQVCATVVRGRDAVATGTLTWSAPDLGIGGTATPFGAAGIDVFEDRCHPTGGTP
jgi:hypothetical protein